MTTTPLSLELAPYGPVSGQLYKTKTPDHLAHPIRLVVLLHGWGADGSDLLPLAPELVAADSGDAVFVPDAPYVCSANPFGRQWFELSDPTAGLGRNAEACQASAGLVTALLEGLCAETGVTSDQIVLGGFSQGGMVSLTGGLAWASPLRGLFCLSGAWLTPDEASAQPRSLPVFLAHGGADPVVPAECMTRAEADLTAAGFSPQSVYRPDMAHGIDPVTVGWLADFLSGL